jgi:hypothetical protein
MRQQGPTVCTLEGCGLDVLAECSNGSAGLKDLKAVIVATAITDFEIGKIPA